MIKIYTSHLKAFTLIELVVVITIIGIISVSTYIPYSHHQKKVLLKQWAREISQSLRDARSLAINGYNTWSGNVNIGLFFASGATNIQYFKYGFEDILTLGDIPSSTPYREKFLPKGIQIDSVDGASQDTLFTYTAISWTWAINGISGTWAINIQISYKWSTDSVLQKTITYFRESYISDY